MRKIISVLLSIGEIISFAFLFCFTYVKLAFNIYPPALLHWDKWGVGGSGPSPSFSLTSFLLFLLPPAIVFLYFLIYRFIFSHTTLIDSEITRKTRRAISIIVILVVLAYSGLIISTGCNYKSCTSSGIAIGLFATMAFLFYFMASLAIPWRIANKKLGLLPPAQNLSPSSSSASVIALLIFLVIGIFYLAPSLLDAAKISVDYLARLLSM